MTAALTIFHRDGGRISETKTATARNLFWRGQVASVVKGGAGAVA